MLSLTLKITWKNFLTFTNLYKFDESTEDIFFWIVLYISDGDRFVHFFVLRLFYHSNLDSYNEELMIVHSVLFMGDASIQYSLLITKSLLLPGIEPGLTDQKSSALPT